MLKKSKQPIVIYRQKTKVYSNLKNFVLVLKQLNNNK